MQTTRLARIEAALSETCGHRTRLSWLIALHGPGGGRRVSFLRAEAEEMMFMDVVEP